MCSKYIHELIWAAGFFDGEGCVYLQKHGNGVTRLRLNITQKDIRPLERFQAVLGGKIYGPRPQPPHTHYLYLNRGLTIRAIDRLWDYISEPKREQIQRCIDEELPTMADFDRHMRELLSHV